MKIKVNAMEARKDLYEMEKLKLARELASLKGKPLKGFDPGMALLFFVLIGGMLSIVTSLIGRFTETVFLAKGMAITIFLSVVLSICGAVLMTYFKNKRKLSAKLRLWNMFQISGYDNGELYVDKHIFNSICTLEQLQKSGVNILKCKPDLDPEWLCIEYEEKNVIEKVTIKYSKKEERTDITEEEIVWRDNELVYCKPYQ